MKLTDIINIKILQSLQNGFTEAFKLPATIYDLKGKPITKPIHSVAFYQLMNSTAITKKKVAQYYAVKKGIPSEKNKLVIKTDHIFKNIITAYMPIFLEEEHIANFFVGPVIEKELKSQELKRFANEMGLDFKKLNEAAHLLVQSDKSLLIESIKNIERVVDQIALIGKLELEKIRRAEEQCKKQQKLLDEHCNYEELLRNLDEGYLLADQDGVVVKANQTIADMCGYKTTDEIIGLHMKSFYAYPDERDAMISVIKKNNRLLNYGLKLKRKNGEIFWSFSNIRIIRNKQGKYLGTEGLIRDISDLKEAEMQFIKAKEKADNLNILLSDVTNNMHDMVAITDFSGRFNYVSPSHKILGYDPQDLLGKKIFDLIHPDDVQEVKRDFEKRLKRIMEDEVVLRIRCADNSYMWLEIYGKVLNKGEIIYSSRDVTSRLEYEKEITLAKERAEDSENKFKAAFYTSPDSVTISKLDGEYVEVNESFCRLTGYHTEEVIGKSVLELGLWANFERRQQLFSGLKTKGIVENQEAEFITKEGKIIPGLISATILNLKNEPHIIAVTKDISHIKEYQEGLIEAKEKAEYLERLKDSFLLNISHEIRTPMNGILGFVDLLKQPKFLEKDRDHFIELIEKSSVRMMNTVQNMIDISKIETGQVEVFNTKISVDKLLSDLFDAFNIMVLEKGLQLNYQSTVSDQYKVILTDEEKLKSILINLIKNAIKYTEKGSITFGCSSRQKHKGELEFFVKDTGIGIPKNRIEAIFNSFEQAGIEDKQVFEGLGLGLAITKSYVEMLGGKIWVKSKENQGSVFYFTIQKH